MDTWTRVFSVTKITKSVHEHIDKDNNLQRQLLEQNSLMHKTSGHISLDTLLI
jgi:hypothetical protein